MLPILLTACARFGAGPVDTPTTIVPSVVAPLGEPWGYIAVSGATDDLHVEGVHEALHPSDGWRSFISDDPYILPSRFEAFAVELSRAAGGPTVVAAAEDKDWAYFALATPKGIVARAVICPRRAPGWDEGVEALQLLGQQTGEPAQVIASEWKRATGAVVDANELRDAMACRSPFAEFALQDLLEALGIPFRSILVD
jgi:hypothetical protein